MPTKKVKKEPVEPEDKLAKVEEPKTDAINANLDPDELHLRDQRPE